MVVCDADGGSATRLTTHSAISLGLLTTCTGMTPGKASDTALRWSDETSGRSDSAMAVRATPLSSAPARCGSCRRRRCRSHAARLGEKRAHTGCARHRRRTARSWERTAGEESLERAAPPTGVHCDQCGLAQAVSHARARHASAAPALAPRPCESMRLPETHRFNAPRVTARRPEIGSQTPPRLPSL